MTPRGRPKVPLIVRDDERETLVSWTRRIKTAQSHAPRARIFLRSSDGLSHGAVAAELRVTPQTVGKWRQRFIDRRLEGLVDEPRTAAREADQAWQPFSRGGSPC